MTAATATKLDQAEGPITYPRALYELMSEPGSGRYGETLPPLCLAHHGEHRVYLGGCYSLPPHDRRFRIRRPRHVAPEPLRVEVVNTEQLGEAMGSGVVLGFRRAREEQRAERRR